MDKLIKGNYQVENEEAIEAKHQKKNKTYTQEFEEKSMEKLGGSIAFVMKENKFVWDDPEEDQKS